MKKLISVTLAAVFCLTLLTCAAVPASANVVNELDSQYDTAKDGDLLYKVQFGLDYGVFKSHKVSIDARRTMDELTVSEDGNMVTVACPTNNSEASPRTDSVGRLWYGDTVDGLTLAEGYRYTIKYKIKNDNSGIGTGNNGFFITVNEGATDHSNSYGAYGNLCSENPFYSLFLAGNKTSGDYRCNASSYVYFLNDSLLKAPVLDEEGFVDCQMEIDGLKYSLFINGNLFDSTTIASDKYELSGKLGIVFYTYTSGGALKDVEIYKGLTLAEANVTTVESGTTKDPYAEDDDDTVATSAAVTATTQATTTAAPTGGSSVTTKPDDSGDEKKTGCGSFALVAQAVVLLGSGAVTFIAVRRKH